MTHAVVLIEAERDTLSTLGGELADIEGVAEAYSVTGEWDFVAIVRVPHHEQLADVVTGEIGGLPGVVRTQTMVAFTAYSRHDLESAVLGRRIALPRRGRIAIKPDYGPTLPGLLAPRWRRASRAVRAAVGSPAWSLVAVIAGAVLTLLNATYGHGGAVPFNFSYRGLYRTAPEPGGYVRVQSHARPGRLEYSFAVDPLKLPPYSGLGARRGARCTRAATSARWPAATPTSCCAGRARRASTAPSAGYQVAYTAIVAGRRCYGRDVLLLHERAGAREGVDNRDARGARTPTRRSPTPLEVATTGVLLRPLKTFALG